MRTKKALIGSLLAFTLFACPVMVQAYPGHRVVNGTKAVLTDAALTTEVKTVLEANKVARNYDIGVDSNKGTVTLTGHVGSRSNAEYIAELVQHTYGVKKVNNRLQAP